MLQANALTERTPLPHACVQGIKGLLFPHLAQFRAAHRQGPGCAEECQRPVAAIGRGGGACGWDAPEQRLLDGGVCLSGSWVGGIPGQVVLASLLAEPWHGSLITRGSRRRRTVQGCLCCVLLFRAALALWGWLVLFLLATGGSLILFCTGTNHQEQY